MTLPVIVLGSGGHAKVVVDTLLTLGIEIIGLTDTDQDLCGGQVLGIPVIGDDDLIGSYLPKEVQLVNGLGAVTLPTARQRIFENFKKRGYSFLTMVHPSAYVARDIKLGDGAQVMAGAVIQPGVMIGANVIVNTRAAIEHDCKIEDHVHIAPGVTMSGGVRIGKGTLVGVGATLLQGVTVGDKCIIGAGSVVLRDVPNATKVKGLFKGGF